MKYVIISVVKGDAGKLNDRLRKEVKDKFGSRYSTLPAHFTIKAPFDYSGSMEELKLSIREFVKREQAEPYELNGYDHFERRVIYMDVTMSVNAKKVHDRFLDMLEQFPYIHLDEKDGKQKILHVTVASKKIDSIYDEIWECVQHHPCNFTCLFNNICLYRLGDTKWELEEEFSLN